MVSDVVQTGRLSYVAGCEKMVRNDEFWDGSFVDMGIERGVWDVALVAATYRTVRIHGPLFHHHLYKFPSSTIKDEFVVNFRLGFCL